MAGRAITLVDSCASLWSRPVVTAAFVNGYITTGYCRTESKTKGYCLKLIWIPSVMAALPFNYFFIQHVVHITGTRKMYEW
jgi:hypothetical protein